MNKNWQTVRVFISSTFLDMQAERDYLVRFIFPRLREELLERRIHFIDVDLRWGVTSEEDTMVVCQEIIDECRPRFLCILGGRYGWVPPGKTRSITAEEVYYGVLNSKSKESNKSFFYFREEASTASMVETKIGEFREPKSTDNDTKLSELKHSIMAEGFNPFIYTADWDNSSRRLINLQKFGDHVYHTLLDSINAEISLAQNETLDEFDQEKASIEAFVEDRTKHFVLGSRGPTLKELLTLINSDNISTYVTLTGTSGSGKSALLARLIQEESLKDQESLKIISHFVGASAKSMDIRHTLRKLCHELKLVCPGNISEIPEDREKLSIKFKEFLIQACSHKRIVILIDAIDQFEVIDYQTPLHWLPEELPANALVILSALDGPVIKELRLRLHNPHEIILKPLTLDDGTSIIDHFCEHYRKKFEPDQRATLLSKKDANSPLYLLSALEELRTLGTYTEISMRITELPPTTLELFIWIIHRLENDDGFRDAKGTHIGQELVSKFVMMLGVSRYGLSQQELFDLLAPDDPQGNISALLHLLRPYLYRRGELINYYHNQFLSAVRELKLNTVEKCQAANDHLAMQFRNYANLSNGKGWNTTRTRPLKELPYHVFEAGNPTESFSLSRDSEFLDAQDSAFPNDPQIALSTHRYAIRAASSLSESSKGRIAIVEFCLRNLSSLLTTQHRSPLEASRSGNLERAWQVIDTYDEESRSLWYILIAWDLSVHGHDQLRNITLDRLINSRPEAIYQGDYLDNMNWKYSLASFILEVLGRKDELKSIELANILLDPGEIGEINELSEQIGRWKKKTVRQAHFTSERDRENFEKSLELAMSNNIKDARDTINEVVMNGYGFRISRYIEVMRALTYNEREETACSICAEAMYPQDTSELVKSLKLKTLAVIAISLIQEDRLRVQQLLNGATEEATTISDSKTRFVVCQAIAKGWAELESIEHAISCIDQIMGKDDKQARSWIYVDLCVTLAEKDSLAHAIDLANQISEPFWWKSFKNEAFARIARALANKGQFEEAQRIVNQIQIIDFEPTVYGTSWAVKNEALLYILVEALSKKDIHVATSTFEQMGVPAPITEPSPRNKYLSHMIYACESMVGYCITNGLTTILNTVLKKLQELDLLSPSDSTQMIQACESLVHGKANDVFDHLERIKAHHWRCLSYCAVSDFFSSRSEDINKIKKALMSALTSAMKQTRFGGRIVLLARIVDLQSSTQSDFLVEEILYCLKDTVELLPNDPEAAINQCLPLALSLRENSAADFFMVSASNWMNSAYHLCILFGSKYPSDAGEILQLIKELSWKAS